MRQEKQIKTNDAKWYAMVISPYLRSHDGKPAGAIITCNDITDIKISKARIEAANSSLIINKDHNTFIYLVSHDLKQLLNNIEALIAALNPSSDAEEVQLITDMLNLSVTKLRETIEELADITKIETETSNAEMVDLLDLV